MSDNDSIDEAAKRLLDSLDPTPPVVDKPKPKPRAARKPNTRRQPTPIEDTDQVGTVGFLLTQVGGMIVYGVFGTPLFRTIVASIGLGVIVGMGFICIDDAIVRWKKWRGR